MPLTRPPLDAKAPKQQRERAGDAGTPNTESSAALRADPLGRSVARPQQPPAFPESLRNVAASHGTDCPNQSSGFKIAYSRRRHPVNRLDYYRQHALQFLRL